MFFKNKSVLVTYDPKLAKDKEATQETKEIKPETVELIAQRTKEVLKYLAITAVATYAAITTIDTVSQIAVKKTKSADNEK